MSDEIEELIEEAKREGFLLCKTTHPEGPGAPGCWLGGLPTLPENLEWPLTQGSGIPDIPLHFVAQINLASLPLHDGHPAMPRTGTLFFFIDPIFGPSFEYSASTAVVLYSTEDVSSVPERQMPPIDLASCSTDDMSWDYRRNPPHAFGLKKWNIKFVSRVGYDEHLFRDPDYENPEAEAAVVQLKVDENDRLRKVLKEHYSGGDKRATHSMLAGPNSRGERYDGSISYMTDEIPLLSVRADTSIGLKLQEEWVVFWIKENALSSADFASVVVFEGLG